MSSNLRYLTFSAKDVDDATEGMLTEIQFWRSYKVIYFDGWNGLGASAVLRSIATVLPSRRTTPELCFDKIVYIDCSKWKNRRGVQRAIAEELQLDRSVMAILNEQDENDDFQGYDESSRIEIDSVSQVIYQTLRGIKLMMIFLNGSDDEVDVGSMGIPLGRYENNMTIWTFSGSCLTMHQGRSVVANKLRYTQLFCDCSIKDLTSSQFRRLLRQQADTIVARNPCMLDIDLTIVADCCLYELFLHYNFHTATKFDWVSHASNYWICDGIIQGERARDISNALHREINWKCDASLLDHVLKMLMKRSESPFLVIKDDDVYEEGPYRWISVTSRNTEVHGMQTIPAAASTFFLAFERSNHPPTLPDGFFDHCTKLGVLVLYCCTFNFVSPPFLKCHGLRFLGLDHCTDEKKIGVENHTAWLCLCSLWVLDLRYTDWSEILSKEKLNLMKNIRELNIEGVRGWQYTAELQGRLPSLQRLRIIKPTCQWETSEDVDKSFTNKTSMEILDLSGNCDMKILPTSLSKACSLRLLLLDGCDELESVGGLPPSLESLSFNGYGPASQWTETVELPPKQFCPSSRTDHKDVRVSKISLAGYTQLKNLFLCWLPNLVELDLSGTAIKILDFKTMVVQIRRLKRLFLIGCKHLRAITFLHTSVPDLEFMCVDTRAGMVCPRPSIGKNKPSGLQIHAVVVDARLTRSLWILISNYVHFNIHVTSSAVYDRMIQCEATINDMIGSSDQESLQLIPAGRYSDVLGMVGASPMQSFPQPPATKSDRHVEIAEGSFYVERGLAESLGDLISDYAESLHVHDVLVRAIMPEYRKWKKLRRCCVERCPKVDIVFPANLFAFTALETLWVSDLLMARSIWSKGSHFNRQSDTRSFQNLQLLQLRSCPSLEFVLPVWVYFFPSLETLHIIHCGNLSHVFILDETYPKEITTLGVLFPKLTTIHLHDLPKLQNICEVKMVAPALKSIKLFLHYNFHTATNFNWVSHASNYWVCDAIIQGERARDISNALHLEINWKCDTSLLDHVLKMLMKHSESTFLVIKDDDVYEEGPYRWISVTSRDAEVHGMKTIPAAASSFFLAFEMSNHPPALPDGFFDHCSKLGVLILYCCAFSFASPSFVKCRGLRFLGLDHCTDDKKIGVENHTVWLSLCSLWVLDLRYTDWNEILSKEKLNLMTNIRELNIEGLRGWQYTAELQGRLPSLQRLRIIKPTCQWETSEDVDKSFTDKKCMEILDLSGNCDMKILPASLSKACSLRLLVLDGCDELESVGGLPPSLESFSFNGYGAASQWTRTVELPLKQFHPSSTTDNKDARVSKISLAGCTQLENVFLCCLPNLEELDLSGTAVKILDFETMVAQVPRLKRLFLIGCKHLRAITSLRASVPDLELMCIDTRAGIVCPRPSISKNKPSGLQMHVVVVDARLTRSLWDMINYHQQPNVPYFNIHITSSPVYDRMIQCEATINDMIGSSDQESLQLIPAGRYSDVLGMVGAAPMQAFPQPPTTKSCRHVEIAEGSFYVEIGLAESLGLLISYYAESLHVHDVLVHAVMPQGSWWGKLRWCCVERCPKVDAVFPGNSFEFTALETFWVSDLLMARWIWSKGSRFNPYGETKSFQNLQLLQLRSCPSLQFVLPVWISSFPRLETLHIIHCGDLSHVFILEEKYPGKITTRGVLFPKLTTIHLHDLPKLQQICEVKMVAPMLESIKIRGCWGLRQLPSVGARGGGVKKPAVEIEKDMWDSLEWDTGHRPEHFEAPVHSRYYKEKLPRVSVLR